MIKNVEGLKFSNNIFNALRAHSPNAALPKQPTIPDATGVLERIRHAPAPPVKVKP